MPDDITRLVADLHEAWNVHDVERIGEFYAHGCAGIDVGQASPLQGRRDVLRIATAYLSAFPDLVIVQDDVVIQGDRVAVSWTAYGTHLGALINVPATGREVQIVGMSIFTVQDGLIIRCRCVWDLAGFLRSVRLLPQLAV